MAPGSIKSWNDYGRPLCGKLWRCCLRRRQRSSEAIRAAAADAQKPNLCAGTIRIKGKSLYALKVNCYRFVATIRIKGKRQQPWTAAWLAIPLPAPSRVQSSSACDQHRWPGCPPARSAWNAWPAQAYTHLGQCFRIEVVSEHPLPTPAYRAPICSLLQVGGRNHSL